MVAAVAAVQDLAEAEPVDPEAEVAPVGAEARAPVEAYGKRERPQAEVVAAEAEERVPVGEGQEAESGKVVAAKKALAVAEALVEAGAEQVLAVRAVPAAEAPLAEWLGVELADPAALEEPALAVRAVLAAEAPVA